MPAEATIVFAELHLFSGHLGPALTAHRILDVPYRCPIQGAAHLGPYRHLRCCWRRGRCWRCRRCGRCWRCWRCWRRCPGWRWHQGLPSPGPRTPISKPRTQQEILLGRAAPRPSPASLLNSLAWLGALPGSLRPARCPTNLGSQCLLQGTLLPLGEEVIKLGLPCCSVSRGRQAPGQPQQESS